VPDRRRLRVRLHRAEQGPGAQLHGGLLLTFPPGTQAFVYHSPFWSNYERGPTWSRVRGPATSRGHRPGRPASASRATWPGVAWRPAVLWTLAADVNHDQWTELVVDRVRDNPGPLQLLRRPAPRTVHDPRHPGFEPGGGSTCSPREGFVCPCVSASAWEPQGAMDPLTRDPVNTSAVRGQRVQHQPVQVRPRGAVPVVRVPDQRRAHRGHRDDAGPGAGRGGPRGARTSGASSSRSSNRLSSTRKVPQT
jgi:hypothetical protein